MALAPLRPFGIERVSIVSMQAVSGAGYPGVASLDILDNVIPYIGGEEEKVESETRRMLGSLIGDRVEWLDAGGGRVVQSRADRRRSHGEYRGQPARAAGDGGDSCRVGCFPW